ncbi:hypothetical protein CDAR_569241 [Caerostris darwini]|uniref:Uncharacterized protein n=1 Tax=Caerostris darwini TaxID=1538125 RepID=A0AAV4NN96_9ARAC|nr:hypothetical protein CDAR_569241 [Caerostris darwini]
MQHSFRHTTEENCIIPFYSNVKKKILFFLSKNKTEIYALGSPNGLRSTNSEINTKYRDHQTARHNDPTLRFGKGMPSGGFEKRTRKMKSVSFHSTWDIPKDGQGRAKQEKERTLPADCLLSVLVYDGHGRRKRYCIQHLEARGWKWGTGGADK